MPEEIKEPIRDGNVRVFRDAKGRLLPGSVLNPKGGVKFSLVSILKDELANVPEGEKEPKARTLIKKIIAQAENGDRASQKLIMNYIEGMPKQNIGLGGIEEDLPILLKVFKDDRTSGEAPSETMGSF